MFPISLIQWEAAIGLKKNISFGLMLRFDELMSSSLNM